MSSQIFHALCPGCNSVLQVAQNQRQGYAFATIEQMAQTGIECKNSSCPVYIGGGGEKNANKVTSINEEENEEERTQVPEIPPFHISLVDPVLLAQMPKHAPMAKNNSSNSYDDDDVFYDGNKDILTQQPTNSATAPRMPIFLQAPTQPSSYTALHAALQAAARGDKQPLHALQAQQAQQAQQALLSQQALHAQQALQAQRAVHAQRAAALSQPQTAGYPQGASFVATGPHTAALHPGFRAQQQQARILQSIQAARTLQGAYSPQMPNHFPARNLTTSDKVTKPKKARSVYYDWEEQAILGLREAGHSFTEIAQRLPRHSTRSIETKWHTLTKGRNKKVKLLSQNQQQQEGRVSDAAQSVQEIK